MSIYLEHIALEKHVEQKLLPILYRTYRSSKSLETTIAMPVDCLRTTTEGCKMGIPPGKSRLLRNLDDMKFGLFSRHFSCKNFLEKYFASPLPVVILSLRSFSIKWIHLPHELSMQGDYNFLRVESTGTKEKEVTKSGMRHSYFTTYTDISKVLILSLCTKTKFSTYHPPLYVFIFQRNSPT